ncbi:hypothetical protein [Devosia sp. MC521]|uniref:hypothetical protein n=1 Tax=Devosia sp. MC521 TaxID=2759954 RepID=UPI0015FE072D|nr:hypothetical protein [Devosia sp. MC521]MBJ6986451.1 hypothetical protein [Devosia sp. MC521]QMW64082.1 hypothetical protein H4N61_07175 [Devosia sp. MC521]
MTEPTSGKLLLIHSHYGTPPGLFDLAMQRGDAIIVREKDLTPEHFAQAKGLITTSHIDQLNFLALRPHLEAFLARGGNWFFNGHILRELVGGLKIYQPIIKAKRADLVLTRINEHPIFEGVDQPSFEENKGVAGFYGRGHNPLPEGGLVVNGIGPDNLPIDWEWSLPTGGRIFSHAGNDIGGMGGPNPNHALVAPRIIAWTMGEL